VLKRCPRRAGRLCPPAGPTARRGDGPQYFAVVEPPKRGARIPNARRRLLEPAVGGLRLRDFLVSSVYRMIREIRHRSGAARHGKVVPTGFLGRAVRQAAIDANRCAS
jgi:hypothetical protein